MRKVSLLIAVLLMVSVGAFAQTVDSTVEAEVSAAFGVQLDEMTTGISNSFSVDWEWVLREEATEEFGEGQMYGYIMVEDLKVSVAADGERDLSGNDDGGGQLVGFSWGDVNGRLVLGAAYIELGMDNITSSADEASMVTKIDQDIVSVTDTVVGFAGGAATAPTVLGVGSANVGTDYNAPVGPEHPGVAFGVEVPELVTVELGAISLYDWQDDTTSDSILNYFTMAELNALYGKPGDADGDGVPNTAKDYDAAYFNGAQPGLDANDDNAYMLSLDVEATPMEMLTLNLVSTMEFGNGGSDAEPGTAGNPVGVGLGVEYEMPLTADINVVPEFGYDLFAMEDTAEDMEMRHEFSAGVNLVWPGLGLDEDGDDHIGFIGDADDEEEVTSGVGLGVDFAIHPADFLYKDSYVTSVGQTPGKLDENVNTLGVKLGLFEDGGDDGLLPIVGGAFMVNYNSILKNEDAGVPDPFSTLGIGLEVNADLGVVAPYAGVKYAAYDLAEKYYAEMYDFVAINLGTDINVIENVTFNIDYASGDLTYDKDENAGADATYGNVYGPANSSTAKLGELAIETTISY